MLPDFIRAFSEKHAAILIWAILLTALVPAFAIFWNLPLETLGYLEGLLLYLSLPICGASLYALRRDSAYYGQWEKLAARLFFSLSLVALLYVTGCMVLGLMPQFRPLSTLANVVLLALAGLAVLAAFPIWLWDIRRKRPFLILLAEFSEGANREPPSEPVVFDRSSHEIKQRVETFSPHLDVRTLAEVVLDEKRAIQLGRNSQASIVGWGWYSLGKSPGDDFVVLDFTPIDPPPGYVHPRGESFYQTIANMDRATLVARIAAHFDCIVQFLLGLERYWAHDDDGAIARFTTAVKAVEGSGLQPDHAPLFFYRGLAWQAKGDLDKAIGDYDQAIRLDPKYAAAYNNRGIAWKAKGDLDKAITDYDQAIRLFPDGQDRAMAYANRGNAWQAKADPDKAIADYDQAIRLFPDGPDRAKAYYDRARLEAKRDQAEAALEWLAQAVQHDPAARTWARTEPDFTSLRDDARFKALTGD